MDARAPMTGPRVRGHSLLRYEDDLDAAVLGAAFQGRVVGHRLELAEGGRREVARLDALLLEIARHVDRARGRELPVGGIALRERGVVTLERADALAQVRDALAELARFHRERALQLGPVGRQLLVALAGVGELALEARVLRLERVVARLGGLHRFRVLALRDAAGGPERDNGERGDRHERLAHLRSPRSQSLAGLPAIHSSDPLLQRRPRLTPESVWRATLSRDDPTL